MDKDLELRIKQILAAELQQGKNLSEAQNTVNKELSLKLTFMEIRMLASELNNIDWNAHDPKAAEAAKEKARLAEKKAQEEAAKAQAGEAAPGAAPASGKTVVTVDKIKQPGVLASGTVKFSSGSTANWYVDETGRPGIDNLKGNPPTQDEAREFMMELQKVLG